MLVANDRKCQVQVLADNRSQCPSVILCAVALLSTAGFLGNPAQVSESGPGYMAAVLS